MSGGAQRFLQLSGQRAHFLGRGAGVCGEPQLSAPTGEDTSPVGDN